MTNYIDFFQQHIQKFRLTLNGQATGLCPLHDDRNPSFSCNVNDGIWKCHGCGKSGNAQQLAQLLGVDPPEDSSRERPLTEVARYTYHDESGKPYLQVRRYSPKTFRQFRSDGNGGWLPGLNGTPPILYWLPEILKSPIVYIVEGEKDVETLRVWKIPATTNPGGAGKWRPEFSESLKGKSVVIIPDRDAPGEKHGKEIACSLWGKAKAIKVLLLPKGKDVTEWKAAGGTLDDLRKLVEATLCLSEPPRLEEVPVAGRLSLVSLRDLLAEPEERFEYLVENLLPSGGLSLLSAKPKTGKSTLARQLVLAVARGEEFLGRKTEKGLSIYLALEERRADVRSHFRKMGAKGDENLKIFAGISPVDGLKMLRNTAEYENPSLIVVDTLARLVRVKDMNDYSQVISALEPLLSLAREVGSHVLLLHHAKKGDSRGIDSILGSTGLAGTVDTIISLHRGEDYRSISSIQRDGNDIPETVLQFDPETRLTTLGGTREQEETERLKKPILDFIAGQQDGVEEKTITEEVEGNNARKKKALRLLLGEGKIVRSGKGKRNDPYLYKVAETVFGTLVPAISPVPENKKSKNELTKRNTENYSGTGKMPLFDSGTNGKNDPGYQNLILGKELVEASELEVVNEI